MNETLTVLNSINEKLGLIVEAMNLDKPAYVKVAEQTLEVSNAKVEEIVPVVQEKEERPYSLNAEAQVKAFKGYIEGMNKQPEIAIGSRVTYTGEEREALLGKIGTVVDLRKAWTVVRFDDDGGDTKCRKKDLSLAGNEQPPEKTEAEVAVEEASQKEPQVESESAFDEEAASFKFEEGSYRQYRDIHAIYSDTKKTEGNRRYLRFRAKNVVKGDTVAKEMCHRYLIGVEDEVYLKEVGA